MGHNHVVLGNSKSIGIPQVDGLSTGPRDLGCHILCRDRRQLCCDITLRVSNEKYANFIVT